jgi:hypothetical protein
VDRQHPATLQQPIGFDRLDAVDVDIGPTLAVGAALDDGEIEGSVLVADPLELSTKPTRSYPCR